MTKIAHARNLGKILPFLAADLNQGKVAVFPTETCYGLGCLATSRRGVRKIFRIKGRKKNKALPLLAGNLEILGKYARTGKAERKLVHQFMPGPLTLLLPKKGRLPGGIGREKIAIRIPGHPVPRKISIALGEALVGTSANLSGKKEMYAEREILALFSGKIDWIILGGRLPTRKPTTLYDPETGRILRPGKIGLKEIERELGKGRRGKKRKEKKKRQKRAEKGKRKKDNKEGGKG